MVLSVIPLALLGAVSPVVFLNATTATANGGPVAGRRLLAGTLCVLAALGIAGMGLLGATAASFAGREIASRAVDAALALVLLGYAALLLSRRLRSRRGASVSQPATSGHQRGWFALGAVGMSTNFTTLPLYLALAQRLGAADLLAVVKVALLGVCTAIVLTPAWLPLLMVRVAPARQSFGAGAQARVARWTTAASIIACLLGGAFLLHRAV